METVLEAKSAPERGDPARCSECGKDGVEQGQVCFDGLDVLKWRWCPSCDCKEATARLKDCPEGCVEDLLRAKGMDPSQTWDVAVTIHGFYARDVDYEGPYEETEISQEDIDIAWKNIKSAIPVIQGPVKAGKELGRQEKLSWGDMADLLRVDHGGWPRYAGQWSLWIEWPLRVLAAMGWIARDGDEFWRLR